MGAFEGLSSFFDEPLYKIAQTYKYNDTNIMILKEDAEFLKTKHIQVWQNLLNCKYLADKRTPLEYGRDLVASWLFEDYFLKEMQAANINIQLSGTDRNRTILPRNQISTTNDYIIKTSDGHIINLELVNDYTGFWYKNEKLHLRDNKYIALSRSKSLLLAIALAQDLHKYVFIDFANNIPATYIPSHRPYGYKPAYEIKLKRDMLNDLIMNSLKKDLNKSICDKTTTKN